MSITSILPGKTVVQHPRLTTVYSLPVAEWGVVTSIAMGRVRPATLSDTLRVVVFPPDAGTRRIRTLIEVSKGVAGAEYELRCGAKSFVIKVSSAVAMDTSEFPEVRLQVQPQATPIVQLTGNRTRQRK